MTAEVDIAPFEADDVEVVWHFFQGLPALDRTFVKEPVTQRADVARWTTDTRPHRYLARAGGAMVGYVGVFPGVGWSAHVGELRLVVDPGKRRQGIGQRLARHGLSVALGADLTKLVVEVVADQEPTIALFTRLGFRGEALLADHVRAPNGVFHDLIVLANRTDENWQILSVVGLDEPLQ